MNAPAAVPVDRAWLAEVVERARQQVQPSGIASRCQEYAEAIVALSDEFEALSVELRLMKPWTCPECGPVSKVDIEGCCMGCGADTAYEPNAVPRSSLAEQTVYCVMSVEDRECVSVWRTAEEAEEERGRLAREHGRWLFYVRANALQGAR